MKRALPLLQDLMRLVANFDEQASAEEMHMPGFIHWLLQREKEQEEALVGNYMNLASGKHMGKAEGMTPGILLTMLITYLFRYAKHYAKKALDGSPLSTLDDFTFLLTLNTQGNMTKSELAGRHLLEVTSGGEILKRLEKQGYVTSFADPNDGRSRQVAITNEGRDILGRLMEQMGMVAHIVAGNLTSQEISRLLPVLMKLDTFHSDIHREDKKADLREITEKYLVGSPG